MPRTPRVTDKLRGKTLIYLGAGLALAGAGIATATAGFGSAPATVTGAKYAVHATAGPTTAHRGDPARHVDGRAVGHAGHRGGPAGKSSHPVHAAASTHHAPPHHAPAHHATHHAVHHATHHATHHAAHQVTHRAVHRSRRAQNQGWGAVSRILAARTIPRAGHGQLPAADRLTPAGTSGPQAWMPITTARWDNARTIVRQTYDRRMGLRSAVIAVATAMQESSLLNIAYGDRDSLGLFQQRPSAGWGSPAQILHPTYAAGAFLSALRGYQARNPAWANQPLWVAAQGVQNSGFPYAYAKWEAQAAALVASITKHLI
jgi:hypothetical protein